MSPCSMTLTHLAKGDVMGPCLLGLCSKALVLSGHSWFPPLFPHHPELSCVTCCDP